MAQLVEVKKTPFFSIKKSFSYKRIIREDIFCFIHNIIISTSRSRFFFFNERRVFSIVTSSRQRSKNKRVHNVLIVKRNLGFTALRGVGFIHGHFWRFEYQVIFYTPKITLCISVGRIFPIVILFWNEK